MSQYRSLLFLLLLTPMWVTFANAQYSEPTTPPRRDFWQHVQFGGGVGLGISSGYTEITVAPIAIYHFNPMFAAGGGLNYTYLRASGYYSSSIYGVNIIGLMHPIPQIELSATLSESFVDRSTTYIDGTYKEHYWYTGLYLGAGYSTQNVTVGMSYNVLFDAEKDIYGDALMPFVRIYF